MSRLTAPEVAPCWPERWLLTVLHAYIKLPEKEARKHEMSQQSMKNKMTTQVTSLVWFLFSTSKEAAVEVSHV